MKRIEIILRGNYLDFSADKIIDDIKLLNRRIKEVKQKLKQDVIFYRSGLDLIKKYGVDKK